MKPKWRRVPWQKTGMYRRWKRRQRALKIAKAIVSVYADMAPMLTTYMPSIMKYVLMLAASIRAADEAARHQGQP